MLTLPLARFIPDAATIFIVAPVAFVYVFLVAAASAWLRVHRGVRTPYTRKTFHFLILSFAAAVHLAWGLGGAVVYGAIVGLFVLYAVARGSGFPFYEALARPTDAPHRTLFILVPLVTTAAGGVLANLLFGVWANVGYVAVAWGDAAGEPVGVRWGRHRYRVPSLAGVPATRSLEGSAAVWLASTIAAFGAMLALGVPAVEALPAAALAGLAAAAVEAVSNHGVDNLTIQLAATAVAFMVLGE